MDLFKQNNNNLLICSETCPELLLDIGGYNVRTLSVLFGGTEVVTGTVKMTAEWSDFSESSLVMSSTGSSSYDVMMTSSVGSFLESERESENVHIGIPTYNRMVIHFHKTNKYITITETIS